jgi:hypothetical protein
VVYVELPTNRHIHNGRDEFLELAKSSGLNVIKDLKVTRNTTYTPLAVIFSFQPQFYQ